MLDDEPVTLKTKHGPIVALPYTFEVHDIVMMALQHHPSEAFLRRAMDHFDCLYAEGERSPRVMALAVHPYLTGAPHRIKYVRQAYEYCLAKPRVKVLGRRADPRLVRASDRRIARPQTPASRLKGRPCRCRKASTTGTQ